MNPQIPLHDRRFQYFPAQSHSDPSGFRERMQERMRARDEALVGPPRPANTFTIIDKTTLLPMIFDAGFIVHYVKEAK